MYGVAGAAAAAAISGMMVAAIVGRTSNRYALARLSQEVVDLRRRGAVEVAKAERFGAASLVKSLAPALDAMDAAAEHATADAEGIRLTRSTLLAALHDHGVEPLAPRVGDAFDPQTMEAMFTVPVADGAPTGKVEKVIRPGYIIHRERLVRASQVGVGAKASAGA